MKSKPIHLALASILALSSGAALAQSPQSNRAPQSAQEQSENYESWRAQQDDYKSDQRDYDKAKAEWETRRQSYEQRQSRYQDQRQEYEAKRSAWEDGRMRYDRRYGNGAYVRRYGEWRYVIGQSSSPAYGPGDRDYYAGYRNSACEQREDRGQLAGGLIGALAGAAIGSNVSSNQSTTEGTVLGAVVGGLIGANIGERSAACDETGYYYSYGQTSAYREPVYAPGQRSGRYSRKWYSNNRCRLAVAPTEWGGRSDYRYVRVCPDRRGRYRITG
jgi:hypothetical protein